MRRNIVFLLAGSAIIAFFIGYSIINPAPQVAYNKKFSIFFRNYKQCGIAKNGFFAYYNMRLTKPPSEPVVSHSPVMPLLMYAAANLFGDKPGTYDGVIIAINSIFFILLYIFIARWWGQAVALWALFFAALSRYALLYGTEQTFEHICLLGGISAIFLYFEWLKTKQVRFFILCVLAYLVGFLGDYGTFFAALVICLHWLFFVKKHNKSDFLKVSLFPVITLGYIAVIIYLMHSAGIPVASWMNRINTRLTGNLWEELFRKFLKYNFILIGFIPIMLSAVFFIFKHRQVKRVFSSSLESGLIYSFLAVGLAPVLFFGNSYIYHPFLVMTLLPFFALSAALGADTLLNSLKAIWVKLILAAVIIFVFLACSFFMADLNKNPGDALKDITNLSLQMKPYLKSGDRLLVSPEKEDQISALCVFYELWIPTVPTHSLEDYKKAILSKEYSLILTVSPEAFNLAKELEDAEILFSRGNITFFRID